MARIVCKVEKKEAMKTKRFRYYWQGEAEARVQAITKEKVLGKLKDLKVNKSPTPDRLHLMILKEIAEENVKEVMNKLDKGQPVDMIYLDFQKAFDKVAQRRLLNKIRAHGDTKIGGGSGSVEEAEKLQKDLDMLGKSAKWQMEYNEGKCEIMHFGTKNRGIVYFLNGERLQKAERQRDLGVPHLRTLGLYLEFRRMREDLMKLLA
eukprot:g34722.t1